MNAPETAKSEKKVKSFGGTNQTTPRPTFTTNFTFTITKMLCTATAINTNTLAKKIFESNCSSAEDIEAILKKMCNETSSDAKGTKKRSSSKSKSPDWDLALILNVGTKHERTTATLSGKKIANGELDAFINELHLAIKGVCKENGFSIRGKDTSNKHVTFKRTDEILDVVRQQLANKNIEFEEMDSEPTKAVHGYAKFQQDAEGMFPGEFDWKNKDGLDNKVWMSSRSKFVSSKWTDEMKARYAKKDGDSASDEAPAPAKKPAAAPAPKKEAKKLSKEELAKELELEDTGMEMFVLELDGVKYGTTSIPKAGPQKTDPVVIVGKYNEERVDNEECTGYDTLDKLTDEDIKHISANTTRYNVLTAEKLETLKSKKDKFPYGAEDYDNLVAFFSS
jgi:hypothetical protein